MYFFFLINIYMSESESEMNNDYVEALLTLANQLFQNGKEMKREVVKSK